MIKLYGHELSGNTYKARLLLALLGIKDEYVRVDLMKGQHKTPEYLKLNPLGQVPLLVDGDRLIPDSQAILVYLARQYGNEQWLPTEAEALSKIIRWLSIAAGEIRQGVEFARLFHLFGVKNINIEVAYATPQKQVILECEVESDTTARDAVRQSGIALAADGKISLDKYPHILAWCDRIKQLPGFIGMAGIEPLVTANDR